MLKESTYFLPCDSTTKWNKWLSTSTVQWWTQSATDCGLYLSHLWPWTIITVFTLFTSVRQMFSSNYSLDILDLQCSSSRTNHECYTCAAWVGRELLLAWWQVRIHMFLLLFYGIKWSFYHNLSPPRTLYLEKRYGVASPKYYGTRS